jgi:hypothetical protein
MAGMPERRRRRGEDPHPERNEPGQRARSYSWLPFEKGHVLSLRNGAWSERTIAPLAQELASWLCERYPDLGVDRYRFSVSAWAHAEARAAILEAELDWLIADGKGGAARERLAREVRAEGRRAAEERRNLGLEPRHHASLELERANAVAATPDLETLRRVGQAALAANDHVDNGKPAIGATVRRDGRRSDLVFGLARVVGEPGGVSFTAGDF